MLKLRYLLLISLSLLFLSGCSSAVYVDDGVLRTEDGEAIVGTHTGSIITEDYFDSCAHNSFGDDCYIVRKFGESDAITTGNVLPISNGETYQTPQTLTTIQVVSNNANDNIAGTGARTVKITGLSTNWEQVEEIVNMSGTTPVTLANQYYRIYRMAVGTSGSYATQSVSSHIGVIEATGTVGGELWARIGVNGVVLGQTEIGVYTIPKGYRAHLGNILLHNNGNKQANFYMFVRNNASDVIAPYESMRIQFQAHGVISSLYLEPMTIGSVMYETTDIGWMANTDTGTTEASVNFEILLIKND